MQGKKTTGAKSSHKKTVTSGGSETQSSEYFRVIMTTNKTFVYHSYFFNWTHQFDFSSYRKKKGESERKN